MSRYVVDELNQAGIGIASATYDIVGFPALEVRVAPPAPPGAPPHAAAE